MATHGYLIGKTEVTLGEWIAWLDTLSPEERARRTPNARSARSSIELRRASDGRWELSLRPTVETLRATAGDPIVYPRRSRRASA